MQSMQCLAAKPTAPRAPKRLARPIECVEDLNWPVPRESDDRKPARRVDVWAPGRDVDWLGTTPTLQ